jgi:hypothetical protein
MSRRSKLGLGVAIVFAASALVAVAALRERQAVSAGAQTGVTSIVCAVPFELAQPYAHDWSAERPLVTRGWLVVVEVDPALARPRQIEAAVLQVGDTVAERVNDGSTSGRAIAIVPDSSPLQEQVVFFGDSALPEAMDLAARTAQRTAVEARGARPFPRASLVAALECGGAPRELADRQALLELAAEWILDYAPDEGELAFELLELPLPR